VERSVEEALILGSVDYGDADRVVTLFTRERGRLSAFAAGARKSKRRFAGALEPCTHLKAQLVQRRGDTWRLDGVDVLATFHRLRDDLPRIGRALYGAELCRELIRDEHPHPELFDTFLDFLKALEGPADAALHLRFTLDALSLAGFRPIFARCGRCEGPTGERPRFDPDSGGALCESCGRQVSHAVQVSPEVVALLAALQKGTPHSEEPRLRATATKLLDGFLSHHLGRRLKSMDFLTQLGLD
jgi:DNA repair protein RecO (recombination protein O)